MLPHLPTTKKDSSSNAVSSFINTQLDVHMSNFAYLGRKTGLNHYQLLKLPYTIYLLYLKHHQILDLQETQEGRDYLNKLTRITNKDVDLTSLRRLGGYKTQEKAGD